MLKHSMQLLQLASLAAVKPNEAGTVVVAEDGIEGQDDGEGRACTEEDFNAIKCCLVQPAQ